MGTTYPTNLYWESRLEIICLDYAVSGLWLFQLFSGSCSQNMQSRLYFVFCMCCVNFHSRVAVEWLLKMLVTGIPQSKQSTAMSYNALRWAIRSGKKHRDSDMSCIVREWTGQFFSVSWLQSMRCHLKHKSDQVAPIKLHLFVTKTKTTIWYYKFSQVMYAFVLYIGATVFIWLNGE